MTKIIADLQIHSKYSRAVSPQMMVPGIVKWAQKKGIGLIATGDWTHPLWLGELKANLEEDGNGLLKLSSKVLKYQSIKGDDDLHIANSQQPTAKFLLSGEVSCIYSQGGKVRRIHTLIWAPDFATVDKINAELVKRGCNLMSDGRPIIGLTSIQLAEVVFAISDKCLVIPAHVWTPWFSLYGSMSGFDTINDAFGSYADSIYAIETGLSSDPAMNWRIKELDNRSILSFSDAHSGPKLGREATVFDLEEVSFKAISDAVKKPKDGNQTKNKVDYTIEFHPEEGKYHFTGHRACNVRQTPVETKKLGTICPTCGRPLTVGVMHRVEELAGRSEEELKLNKKEITGTKVTGVYSETYPNRPPYTMLVPLQEILSESLGLPVGSVKVQTEYERLCDYFKGEFELLLNAGLNEISKAAGERTAEGIDKVRRSDIVVDPGYDGVFGVVKIWNNGEEKKLVDEEKKQMSLF